MDSKIGRARSLSFVYLAVILVASAQLAFAQSVTVTAEQRIQHVRPKNKWMTTLIDEGSRRSSVFQGLIDHLNQSDVVVYVERGQLPRNLSGQLMFVGASPPWRYLRVQIDCQQIVVDQIATLGHELQHAVEIADAANVVSPALVKELYTTIGFPVDASGRRYETDAARDTGQRVHRQLSLPVAAVAEPSRARVSD